MLNLCPVPHKAKSDMICRAFAHGAPRDAEGSVFFGTEGQMSAFQKAKASGKPWFYIDNSYFDKHRGIYFRVTKNALQVDPRGKTSDGKRFEKLKIEVKPERPDKHGSILLVPQSDQFMKSTGYAGDWLTGTAAALRTMSPTVGVLVHPWQRDKIARGEAFAERLSTARLVITHSSAAAITALLEGVPAISTSDTAAAHWIGGPLSSVNDPVLASVEERVAFASVLADNQGTLEEFRNGDMWRWLAKN